VAVQDPSCGNTSTVPVNSGILWERSIVVEGTHSFCPAKGYIESTRTGLFPFQVTRIDNQVTKHIVDAKSGLKTLKFVNGCGPRNF
jgi:hypothetical protein